MDDLTKDAYRWRCLLRHAIVGVAGAPSGDAVVRVPVLDSDDTTLTELVDRLLWEDIKSAQG